MGKTIKGKDKAARKTAAAKRKIERKAKGGKVAAILAVFALALAGCQFLTGCSTAQSDQPAKSQTQENKFDNCIFVVATQASVSNRIVNADGTKDIPAVEMFTQTQSLESTGSTDSYAGSTTQTPTTDVRPDVNVNYANGGGITNRGTGGAGTGGAAGIIDKLAATLTDEGLAELKSALANKKDGTITLQKKDGTTTTATCKDGTCTLEDGTTVTAADCASCTTCTDSTPAK